MEECASVCVVWCGERERVYTRGWERAQESTWLLLLYVFFPLGLSYANWAQPGVLFYLKSSLRSLDPPLTFLCSIFAGFSFPCLLATAILDFFSLFYLPNILPSRDGRPNSLGIGASRSFWLLPAELGWRGVLGLPLLLVSGLRVLRECPSKDEWYFLWLAVVLYLCWTGSACCSLLTWAETKQVRQMTVHGTIISIINMA